MYACTRDGMSCQRRERKKEAQRRLTGGGWVEAERTLHGVFGIARTTFVEGRTIPWSWRIVTPARMLMRSLPSRASFIPGSLRIVLAIWGLQLQRVSPLSRFDPRAGVGKVVTGTISP